MCNFPFFLFFHIRYILTQKNASRFDEDSEFLLTNFNFMCTFSFFFYFKFSLFCIFFIISQNTEKHLKVFLLFWVPMQKTILISGPKRNIFFKKKCGIYKKKMRIMFCNKQSLSNLIALKKIIVIQTLRTSTYKHIFLKTDTLLLVMLYNNTCSNINKCNKSYWKRC